VFAADGKCLRGAKRPDGSQLYIFSAVRHHDALTVAAREVGAKTNEIPEFQPLMGRPSIRAVTCRCWSAGASRHRANAGWL
jgi:hypothetical protein